MRTLALTALLGAAGCASPAREDFDRLRRDLEPLLARHENVPRGPSTDAELDRLLSGPLDLETVLEAGRRRNPELREALARVQAGLEEVQRAGAFDDPMFTWRPWQVPLRQPLAFDQADMNMVGLSQSIPFPGNLGLRSEAALRDAEAARERYLERELELTSRLKKAYFEYFVLSREVQIHTEHVRIMEEFEKVSDAKFRTGSVSQQDVLKPQVELVMLHNEVLFAEQRLETVQAQINAFLNRPAGAPLGIPGDLEPGTDRFDVRDHSTRAVASRPEARAAELRVRSSKAALDLAEREATLPDFAVGLDWMIMTDEPDAWGGMFSINLPWLTGKRSAESRKMRHTLRADEISLEGTRSRILFDVRDAFLRVEAARRSLVLFKGELLPKTAQSVEVSRAGYEKDKVSFLDLLDAERSQRDVKLKYAQAIAQYESAVADLERAVGEPLRKK